MPSCRPRTTHRLIPALASSLWGSKSCLKDCGFTAWLWGHWVPTGENPTSSLAWPSRSPPSCVPHAACLAVRCDEMRLPETTLGQGAVPAIKAHPQAAHAAPRRDVLL